MHSHLNDSSVYYVVIPGSSAVTKPHVFITHLMWLLAYPRVNAYFFPLSALNFTSLDVKYVARVQSCRIPKHTAYFFRVTHSAYNLVSYVTIIITADIATWPQALAWTGACRTLNTVLLKSYMLKFILMSNLKFKQRYSLGAYSYVCGIWCCAVLVVLIVTLHAIPCKTNGLSCGTVAKTISDGRCFCFLKYS